MSAVTRDERHARRIADLYATDPQFASARPDASFPIRFAMSPGAQDHCVPIDAPSSDTDTIATLRSFPSRASLR